MAKKVPSDSELTSYELQRKICLQVEELEREDKKIAAVEENLSRHRYRERANQEGQRTRRLQRLEKAAIELHGRNDSAFPVPPMALNYLRQNHILIDSQTPHRTTHPSEGRADSGNVFDFNNPNQPIPSLSPSAGKHFLQSRPAVPTAPNTAFPPSHPAHDSGSPPFRFQARSRKPTSPIRNKPQSSTPGAGGGGGVPVSESMRELQRGIVRRRLGEVADWQQQLRFAQNLVVLKGENAWTIDRDGSRIKAKAYVERVSTRLKEAKDRLQKAREDLGRE